MFMIVNAPGNVSNYPERMFYHNSIAKRNETWERLITTHHVHYCSINRSPLLLLYILRIFRQTFVSTRSILIYSIQFPIRGLIVISDRKMKFRKFSRKSKMYTYTFIYVLHTDRSKSDCRSKIEFRGGGRKMIVGNRIF